jgi:hypothetical protein
VTHFPDKYKAAFLAIAAGEDRRALSQGQRAEK